MVVCNIRFFNNPHGVYYSGQKLTGKVEITLLRRKNVEAIILNITGCAKTKLREYNHSAEKHEVHVEREKYLDNNTFLVGSPGGKTITLDPGVYTFNFTCNLPLGLPSSFEGKHGHIRYLAKVILKRSWKFNQEYVAGFTVVKQVDLNLENPNTKAPFKLSTTKQLRSGLFSTQPFSIVMRLPHMGFVPGQIIPISMNVQNRSNTNAENLQISFKQIVTFKAQFKPKKQKFKSEKVKTDYSFKKNYGRIEGQSNKTISQEIRVPPVPPTSKNSCSIISIEYAIEVKVYFGFFQSKLKMDCPIIIGTVPLFVTAAGGISNSTQNSNTIRNSSRNDLNTRCSTEVELPSYEEAVQMNMVTVSDEDESNFLPRYPLYRSEDKCREQV